MTAGEPTAGPEESSHIDTAHDAEQEEIMGVLLSSVAENVYWAGRYLERAEATARLVRTHTELYLDLPLAAGLTWAPLLAVTGSGENYRRRTLAPDEDGVVRYLLVDADHPASVRSSVAMARADLRVVRPLLPQRSWEVVNELHLWIEDGHREAVDRSTRLRWCEELIRRCHLVTGSIVATMTRDQAFSFLEIGRMIERADMTTRVLDVEAELLSGDGRPSGVGALGPYTDLTWMAALRALGGEQMFRRSSSIAVSGPEAIQFLLRNTTFPRSVEHCLIEISRWLLELPRQEEPMAGCVAVQRQLDASDPAALATADLRSFVDALQRGLGALHDQLSDTYFLRTDALTPA